MLWHPLVMQEDDVIGLLPGGDDISKLQPLQVRLFSVHGSASHM